jgi:hypothetical protein
MSLVRGSWHHESAFPLLPEMQKKLSMQILYIKFGPKFWADYYTVICTHFISRLKSVGSNGSNSLPLMMKVMVWFFVSDTHKVIIALIPHLAYFPVCLLILFDKQDGRFDPLNQAARVLTPAQQKKEELNPEYQCREMERHVNQLLEASAAAGLAVSFINCYVLTGFWLICSWQQFELLIIPFCLKEAIGLLQLKKAAVHSTTF